MAVTNGGPLRAPEPTQDFLEFFSTSGSFTLAKYDTSTASMWDGTMEYYTPSGWVVWNGSTISSINSGYGSYIHLRGTGNTRTGVAGSTSPSNGRFVITGSNVRVNGNIETLLDHATVVVGNHPAMAERCFQYLFYNCTAIISPPTLPATTLTAYCYSNMFRGTSITTPPALPATTLAENCYRLMFRDCSSLTSAPELPATTLAENCYAGIFYNCSSITSAPELPVTTLAAYCYYSMFYGCTGLTSAPELPATIMTEYCYAYMFQNCSSITSAPELPATTLAPYCYYVMFTGCSSLTSAPELPATTLATYCYCGMFQNCVSLTSAPELPATTLATYCYYNIFYECTGLTSAPELPATTLAENCYRSMFYNCVSLTSAPELPATTLAAYCYRSMFQGCASLTVAPLLQISIVSDYCCAWMFQDCVNLEVIPEIPDCTSATTSLSSCFYGIFLGCTKVAAKSLPSGTSNKPYRVPIISGATTKNNVVAGMLLTDKSGEDSYSGPTTEEGGTYYVAAQVIKVQPKNKLVINAELYEAVEGPLQLLPVGGTIFYIDNSADGTYTFYDSNGTPVSAPSVGSDYTGYYYTVDGATKDKYYIMNSNSVIIPGDALSANTQGCEWTYLDEANQSYIDKANYTTGDYTYAGNRGRVFDNALYNNICLTSIIGAGKYNTNAIMNIERNVKLNGTTTYTKAYVQEPCIPNAAATGYYSTIWYILNQFNNNESPLKINTTGISDWYVPSAAEMEALLEAFESFDNFVQYFTLTSSVAGACVVFTSSPSSSVSSCAFYGKASAAANPKAFGSNRANQGRNNTGTNLLLIRSF